VWAADIEFRAVGENLAMAAGAADPVTVAVEGWMESDSHRENILRGDWEETAVGVCIDGDTFYFTQVFLERS
jgi:uncharacterized protein YkwD